VELQILVVVRLLVVLLLLVVLWLPLMPRQPLPLELLLSSIEGRLVRRRAAATAAAGSGSGNGSSGGPRGAPQHFQPLPLLVGVEARRPHVRLQAADLHLLDYDPVVAGGRARGGRRLHAGLHGSR
jgi:hypothetical protein